MLSATGIKTELGNRILHALVQSGWRVEYAYPDSMIDKGVDYDRYKVSNAAESVEFEWDNWEEWQIRGTPDSMLRICQDFGIALMTRHRFDFQRAQKQEQSAVRPADSRLRRALQILS